MNPHFSSPCIPVQVTPTHSSSGWEDFKITNRAPRMKITQQLLPYSVTSSGFLVIAVGVTECYFWTSNCRISQAFHCWCLWLLTQWLTGSCYFRKDRQESKVRHHCSTLMSKFFFFKPKEETCTWKLKGFWFIRAKFWRQKGLLAIYKLWCAKWRKKKFKDPSLADTGSLFYEPQSWKNR